MMMGKRLLPGVSPNTNAKEPDCDWLEESPSISNLIFSNLPTAYLAALMAAVSLGTTSKASPTIP